jgi:hypothetical protein
MQRKSVTAAWCHNCRSLMPVMRFKAAFEGDRFYDLKRTDRLERVLRAQ